MVAEKSLQSPFVNYTQRGFAARNTSHPIVMQRSLLSSPCVILIGLPKTCFQFAFVSIKRKYIFRPEGNKSKHSSRTSATFFVRNDPPPAAAKECLIQHELNAESDKKHAEVWVLRHREDQLQASKCRICELGTFTVTARRVTKNPNNMNFGIVKLIHDSVIS